MTWTERYLAAVLRSIPPSKRDDVERELRSSIEDGIEERLGAGEERTAAERTVLEGLGDPAQLAWGYSGRPTYLLSPELFPLWRRYLSRVLLVAVPISAVVIGGLDIAGGGMRPDAAGAAISGAIGVAIQTTFWMTAFFVFLDWAGPARQARAEILAAAGHWTLERLPKVSTGRISVGEAAGEIVTVLIALGVLLFSATLSTTSPYGTHVALLAEGFRNVWLPVLFAMIAVRGVVHARAYIVGRWTPWLTVYHGLLQLAFGLTLATLALAGWIFNSTFGITIGWPNLHDGEGPVMRTLALGAAIVTGYDILRIILRARRGDDRAQQLGTSTQSI